MNPILQSRSASTINNPCPQAECEQRSATIAIVQQQLQATSRDLADRERQLASSQASLQQAQRELEGQRAEARAQSQVSSSLTVPVRREL